MVPLRVFTSFSLRGFFINAAADTIGGMVSFSCIVLKEVTVPCGYIDGERFTTEHMLVNSIDDVDLDILLRNGFRHFGSYFFRPICSSCSRCIPLRIPLSGFGFPRSARRLSAKNREFTRIIEAPRPSGDAFTLYRRHKKRFGESGTETYDQFVESFFYPLQSNLQLSVYDGKRLIAVAHLDVTVNSLSAVYCYWDETYEKRSLGTHCINTMIAYAMERDISFCYLGYYIIENRHMRYKANFRPNQLCVGKGEWKDYITADGSVVDEELPARGFSPKKRLIIS